MRKRKLGTSDLEISTIGIGSFALGGGGWQYAWGPQKDKDSIAAIRRALEAGVNWIDTAAAYGLGHAEKVVKKALRGLSERPYVFTKCGLVWDGSGTIESCLTEKSIRKEVEGSLNRLGVDVIDLYQIHWPRPPEAVEEAWSTLSKLKDEGKVRYIGVSNFDLEQLRQAEAIAPVTSLQPPYSVLDREIEADLLTHAREHRIGVIAYSPLKNGLLAGKITRNTIDDLPDDDWRKRASHFQEPELSRNLATAEALASIGRELSRTPAEIAIAWVLHNPAVTGAIVGARNPDQVDGFIRADSIRLSDEHVARIDRLSRG